MNTFFRLSTLLLAVCCLGACTPEDQSTSITVSFTPKIDIPATHGVTYEVETHSDIVYPNLQGQLDENQSDTSLITNIEPTNIQINLDAPAGSNFDFVDDMELYMQASGLPEKKIGTLKNTPTGQTTVQFNLESDAEDLASYLKSSNIAFVLKYTSDEYTGTDMEATLLVAFKVDAETTNP